MATKSRNIADKFIINAALVWDSINSDDCAKFMEMKRIRDKMAHGEFSAEASLPLAHVEELMSKLVENYHILRT